MLQTLQQVLENRAAYTGKVDAAAKRCGSLIRYEETEMDAVVVWPDAVAKRYLELMYLYNTHFVPGRLPGAGMATGDFITHEKKTYLAVGFDVCCGNMRALHLFREHEEMFRLWEEKKEGFDARVKEFTGELTQHFGKLLGIGALQKVDKWRDTVAGSQYVGTPDRLFVGSLSDVVRILRGRKKKGSAALARLACSLIEDLRPFFPGADIMEKIREETHHKGIPFIGDGIIGLTSPTASGGASLHNKNAGDDLIRALPNRSDLVMVAGQVDHALVPHFGGGHLRGESYIMLLPRTPFFEMVQERVDTCLAGMWQSSADGSLKAVSAWNQTTMQFKEAVVKKVVPEIVAYSVLGFCLDMKEKPGTALLRPIVSASALAEGTWVQRLYNLTTIRNPIHGVLVDMGGYYGKARSIFDQEALAA